MINVLQEKRNKLMSDAALILRSESATTEQLDGANKMVADAGDLEKRIAQLKQVEAFEAEQRSFVPAARPSNEQVTGAVGERSRAISAVRSYLQNGRVAEEYRDLLTTSSASAGVTVPQLFDATLIEALREYAPVLDVVDHQTTNNNGAPIKMTLINYTNTVLPLVAEGTAFPEIDPSFSSEISYVDKLGGQVKISAEQLADSGFNLASWLTDAWANVVGVSLEHYVTLGNASNIASLTAMASTGVTSSVSGQVAYPDVAALFGSLTQAYTRNGSFMMSTGTRAALMGLVATTGNPIFDASPAGSPFTSIFGRPVVINDSMPSLAAGNKAILFGDFKKAYYLRTDGTPTIKRLDERYADTDEVGFIIRTRVGGISKNAGIPPVVALTIHA